MFVPLSLLIGLAFQGTAIRIPGLAPAPTPTATLAKVDGFEIKADDVAALLWEARGEEILNDLIAFRLIKAEADRLGVVVTDQAVQTAVASQLKQYGATLPTGTDPEVELAASGLTKSRFFLNVKTDLLLNGIATLQFRPADYIKVSTILVVPKTPEKADVDIARTKVQGAYDRLKAGETWAKVSEETIEDPNGKKTGGLLGWRPIELFPTATRAELSALAPNGISTVSQTPYGVQLFRVEMTGKAAGGPELEELKRTALPDVRTRILRDLRTKAKIERTAAKKPAL